MTGWVWGARRVVTCAAAGEAYQATSICAPRSMCAVGARASLPTHFNETPSCVIGMCAHPEACAQSAPQGQRHPGRGCPQLEALPPLNHNSDYASRAVCAPRSVCAVGASASRTQGAGAHRL